MRKKANKMVQMKGTWLCVSMEHQRSGYNFGILFEKSFKTRPSTSYQYLWYNAMKIESAICLKTLAKHDVCEIFIYQARELSTLTPSII